MTGERWPRVTRRNPCPICRRPDWCQISPDGVVAKCMRNEGGFMSGDSAIGAYSLHRIDGQRDAVDRVTPQTATPHLRDAVYGAILDELTLTPEHAEALLKRGFDHESIARNGYATMPSFPVVSEIIDAISKNCDMTGMSGIEARRGRWILAADAGDLLIPVRNSRWQIVALLRRTNDSKNKYKWCSTKQASSGAPVHHAEPWNVEFRPSIYITEGALKADLVANVLGFTTIGLAGCAAPAGFAAELRAMYPTAQSVFVALDSDAAMNPHVARARATLEATLVDAGHRVRRIEWDAELGKGLDDVLAAIGAVAR